MSLVLDGRMLVKVCVTMCTEVEVVGSGSTVIIEVIVSVSKSGVVAMSVESPTMMAVTELVSETEVKDAILRGVS